MGRLESEGRQSLNGAGNEGTTALVDLPYYQSCQEKKDTPEGEQGQGGEGVGVRGADLGSIRENTALGEENTNHNGAR